MNQGKTCIVIFSPSFSFTLSLFCVDVSVSNPLSTASSTLHLSVLQPSPDGMVVSVPHGPLGVSPRSPRGSNRETVEEAYLGDPVTLQAHMADGVAEEFFRWITRDKKEEDKKVVKAACNPTSDCSISTVVSGADGEALLH